MARIGMVSIWFHRGQSEVTRTIRQALLDNGHEVFIFARMGGVFGQEMQDKDDPYWKLPNIFWFPKYQIPENALKMWASANKLDAVIFNEEYDFNLPTVIQIMGLKAIHYVDFIRDDWASGLRVCYDQLWSATHRTSFLLESLELGDKLTHIGWGVHPDSTQYLGDQAPQYDFFHNAGWLGINFRKGTDLVLQAFDQLRAEGHEYSLLIHAQVPPEVVDFNPASIPGLTWRYETVPQPGLYHLGKVCVQPSRLEGLGLTLVEALYQGRALVTTDAPPMNEFVFRIMDRVKVAHESPRSDGLSFPECVVDVDHLAKSMRAAMPYWKLNGMANRSYALTLLDWECFRNRIQHSLSGLGLEGHHG
jgi:1,2-diacylglycerol 3-alpha-glucosyltransferase